MSRETSPSAQQETPSIFRKGVERRNEDGSFNEAAIDKTALSSLYGLQVEDAKQEVTFGSYKGSVADMLSDCPHVGAPLRKAYEQNGIDGVIAGFAGLKMFSPDFNVQVSEETIELEQQKKNRSQSQTQVFPPMNL